MIADDHELLHILSLARADVLRGQANLALEHLKTIHSQVDNLEGTAIWVEHQLVYAGALAGKNDPDTSFAFEETLERIRRLTEPSQELELRAHGDFAKYLAGRRILVQAREHYRIAEQIAADLGHAEEAARFQMCMIKLDLEERADPRLKSFQNLKNAAMDRYTAEEQRDAWIHYVDEIKNAGKKLIAARDGATASVDYFCGVLSEIRRNHE